MNADAKEPDHDNRDPETYEIIGAAMEVHRELGYGFLEAVYHDALEKEFKIRNISYVRELPVPVQYKGELLKHPYRVDFLCFDSVVVELKSQKTLTDTETAQVIHYLKATKLKRALLVNFSPTKLVYRRLVNQI